jgi:hypothetical protein
MKATPEVRNSPLIQIRFRQQLPIFAKPSCRLCAFTEHDKQMHRYGGIQEEVLDVAGAKLECKDYPFHPAPAFSETTTGDLNNSNVEGDGGSFSPNALAHFCFWTGLGSGAEGFDPGMRGSPRSSLQPAVLAPE